MQDEVNSRFVIFGYTMPNISNFSDLRKDHKQNKPSAKSMKSKDKVPDYRSDFVVGTEAGKVVGDRMPTANRVPSKTVPSDLTTVLANSLLSTPNSSVSSLSALSSICGANKAKRNVDAALLTARDVMPSRDNLMTSRDNVMTPCDNVMTSRDNLITSRESHNLMSRDNVMTSRDNVMTSRDSVISSRDAASSHDAALASALLQQQQVLRQQFLLAHYQQLSALQTPLQTPLVHQILQPQEKPSTSSSSSSSSAAASSTVPNKNQQLMSLLQKNPEMLQQLSVLINAQDNNS